MVMMVVKAAMDSGGDKGRGNRGSIESSSGYVLFRFVLLSFVFRALKLQSVWHEWGRTGLGDVPIRARYFLNFADVRLSVLSRRAPSSGCSVWLGSLSVYIK